MKTKTENKTLTLFFEDRIDTTNAPKIESEVLEAAQSGADAENIVIDADKLEYISSAGLRILMKLLKKTGKRVQIINASRDIYDILETTGFTELMDVSKKMREVSVEGCEIIGKGAYGTVYRIDDETVVKAYSSPDSLSMIQNEKLLAKTALIAGVPTAISYDIVRVGNNYGSVFELLNAKNFNDMLIEHPENADEIIKQYAEFMQLVNSQTVPAGKLRSAKAQFMGYLDTASEFLDADLCDRLRELLSEIPEQNNVIHGDAQMKNIMVVDGEPMLIDMDTLCAGHPIFDIQSVYVTYFAFGEDDPSNSMIFLGIPSSLTAQVWEKFIGYYFKTSDEARIAELRDKITIAGCIRFIYLINLLSDSRSELFKLQIRHTAERLKELAYKVDTLLFE